MALDIKRARAGDHVTHRETLECNVVAYVDGEYFGWCGWPSGEDKLAHFDLTYACTDEQHLSHLLELAKEGGKRRLKALEALKAHADEGLAATQQEMIKDVIERMVEHVRGRSADR